jgi:hypothetical protein
MARVYPDLRFERYADDALVHCRSEAEARSVLEAIRGRLADCGLELHPTKTRIVYCKDDDRPGQHEHIAFDFLGYTFQPRRAKNRWAWIMMRSATDSSKADLHVFSKLFDDGLERGQEAKAFSWRQIGGHDDVLDFFVGHLINVDMTRQPAP